MSAVCRSVNAWTLRAAVLVLCQCCGSWCGFAASGVERSDVAATRSIRRLADKELSLGIAAPFSTVDPSYLAAAVALLFDFQKNWDTSMVTRFGDPVIAIPSLDSDLRLKVQIGNCSSLADMIIGGGLGVTQASAGCSTYDQIVGVVGGCDDTVGMSVGGLTSAMNIPHISFSTSADKQLKPALHPFFSRAFPGESLQGIAMWNFVDHLQIPVLACVFSEGASVETVCRSLSDAATAAGSSHRIVGVGLQDMPSNYDNEKARAAIRQVKSAETRFVFVAMDVVQGRNFFVVAAAEGLFAGDWQLIGSQELSLASLEGSVSIPLGYLYLSCQTRGTKFSVFESLWTQMTTDDMNTSDYGLDLLRQDSNVSFPVAQTFSDGAAAMALAVPFLFDAGYAFVMAANALLQNGTAIGDIREERLLGAVRAVSFEGVSGTVAFDQYGGRLAVYNLVNVIMANGSKSAVVSTKYNGVNRSVSDELQVSWQSGNFSFEAPVQLTVCPAGKYRNRSTLMCDMCQIGTFSQGGVGVAACSSCPPGRYSDQAGQSECLIREIVLGIYAPVTSVSMTFLIAAVLFDLDFRKNFNASLAERFGEPIINISNLNPNLRFKVQIGNSNSQQDTSVRMALEMFQGRSGWAKVSALVGGYHSAICGPINQLAAQFHVPQVGWACSSPALSNKEFYPWFARTFPPDSIQGRGFWALIGFFPIPSVVLMYAQDPYGEGMYTVVHDLATAEDKAFRINGLGMPVTPAGSYDAVITRAKIQSAKSMHTKFMMLVMAGSQASVFFPIAEDEGLFGTDWQLLASEALPFAQFPDLPVGYMWLSPRSRSALFDKFSDMWKLLNVSDIASTSAYGRYGIEHWTVPLDGGDQALPTADLFASTDSLEFEQFLFDACYAVAIAANELMNDGVDAEQIAGQRLLDAVEALQFDAVTGSVSFDANGDRLASYNLNNVQPDGSGGKVAKISGVYSAETASITLNDVGLYWQTGTTGNTIPYSLIACTPGQYRNFRTRLCEACPEGTYSEDGAGAQCENCPQGKFQDEVGQTGCNFYEIALGIYGPLTSISMTFLATAVAFDLDFRKNFNSTLVDRFGPPIVTVPDLNENLRIKVQIGTSNSQQDTAINLALNFFQGQGGFEKIQGLVGGYHSAISMPVNNLAAQFDVPQVSWGSTSPKLSNKETYKYFCRTIPPDSLQGSGMWEFMIQLAIPAAAFMYARESYGEGLFSTVYGLATAAGMSSKVSGVGIAHMPTNYDDEEAKSKIIVAKATGAKMIFLAMTADQGRLFFPIANQKDSGFGVNKFQLIGSEALTLRGMGSERVPLGYIFFAPISRGALFSQFQELWEKMTSDDVVGTAARSSYKLDRWTDPTLDESSLPLPSNDLFADVNNLQLEDPFIFDAAYTFVIAFNQMMNDGVRPAQIGGEPLLKKVQQLQFEGISGTVSFDGNCDRYASYTINNVVATAADSGRRLEDVKMDVVAAVFDSSKVGTDQDTISFVLEEGILWQDGTAGKAIPSIFTACEPGFSAAKAGEQCIKCHAGSFSLGGSMKCEDCPPGKMTVTGEELGATGCVDCDDGSIAKLPGSTKCEKCPTGTVSNGSHTVCERCPQGFYQDKVAGTECMPCGASQTTAFQGAETFDDCKCVEGFYDPRLDFATNKSCVPCVTGMTCQFGSDMANYLSWNRGGRAGLYEQFPVLQPSFASLASDPLFVYECKDEARCPGGPPGTCGPNLDTEIISCAQCKPASYWTGVECKACSSVEASAIVFPITPLLIAPCVVSVMYYLFRDDVQKWGSWQNGVTALAFIVLNHYQISALANQANLDMPSRVSEYLGAFMWTDDFIGIFKPQCAGYNDFERSMILRALGPLVGVFLVAFTYLGSHLTKMFSGLDVGMGLDRTNNVYFSIVFTFFAAIASMALTMFKCHANPNGVSTLVKDESIHCFESRWNNMVIVAALAVLVYIVGCGALFLYIIYIGPMNFHEAGFQRRWKFLFIKYRPDVWWWAMAFVAKGVIINVGYVFFELGIQQLFWIMACMVVYAVVAAYHSPWRLRIANLVELYMHMALLLMIALLSWFAHGSMQEAEANRMGSDIQLVIMIVNLSPAILTAPIALLLMRYKTKQSYVENQLEEANLLRRYMKSLAALPDDEFTMFLLSLDDWSVWHMRKAFIVTAAELAGNYATHKGLSASVFLRRRTEMSSGDTSHISKKESVKKHMSVGRGSLVDNEESESTMHVRNSEMEAVYSSASAFDSERSPRLKADDDQMMAEADTDKTTAGAEPSTQHENSQWAELAATPPQWAEPEPPLGEYREMSIPHEDWQGWIDESICEEDGHNVSRPKAYGSKAYQPWVIPAVTPQAANAV